MTLIKRNNSPVPEEVIENVKRYLEKENLGELVKVVRMSDHPEDDYLYGVIAKKESKYFPECKYSCWTCWNETTQSMNYGYYNISSVENCEDILKEHFHKMYGVNVVD